MRTRRTRAAAPAGGVLVALALACQGCDDGSGAATPDALTLTVTTINLRNKEDWWEDRIPLLAKEFVALDADVTGLQEVSTPDGQAEALLEAIGDAGSDVAWNTTETLKPEPYATLTGEALGTFTRFPVVETDKVFLSEGRVASFERLDVGGGLYVDFYNTHLHPEGGAGDIRAAQIDDILELREEHDEGWPTVLVGDLNGTSEEPWHAALLDAGFVDAYLVVHREGAETDGATVPVELARESVTQELTRRIDFIFAHRGTRADGLAVTRAELAYDEPAADGLYPSDHLGVTAELVFSLK